ncbi:MAG: crotonase [Myxococcales bacterium FL481]|nr:MAG: crotonase [Myxococcales bacterium FL481]
MSRFETIQIEDRGPARVIAVNRPKVLNALSPEVVAELSHALEAPEIGRSVSGLVLTGTGDKAFVAGADISRMVDMTEDDALLFASQGHAVGDMLGRLPVPVIAAVQGFALGGGCELALACDFIYASPNAKFGQPEVKLGVIPGFGGTQRLARRVGVAAALELCVTGATIDATEAYRLGLVNRVVDDACAAAVATIEKVSAMGPLAVAAAKDVIHRGAELPLDAANQSEIEAFAALFRTEDQREGMQAFVAKRRAQFGGK